MRFDKRIAAAATAGAVVLGGVGFAIALTPASADQPERQPAQIQQSVDRPAPEAGDRVISPSPRKARGTTVVTFSAAAVQALAPLSPSAVRPGAFGISPNGLSAQGVFPIVGKAKAGRISHVGGLKLTDGKRTLVLRNFVIDTNRGVLTANGFVDRGRLARINFLNVALTAPAPGCDASANLTLAAPAAKALSALFDAPDLTGAPIGTACVGLR